MGLLGKLGVILVLGILGLGGTVQGYKLPTVDGKTLYPRDPKTGHRFFWFQSDKGEITRVYLDGAPPARQSRQEVEDEVHFYLYTKGNPDTPVELTLGCTSCLENSNFNPSAPLKIVCHGFMSDYESDINQVMREAYLRVSGDINIIIMNWSKLAEAPWYEAAANNTKPVGQFAATFVDFLVDNGYTTYDKVHFSGHSLGSHVGGYLGSNTASKIARITAMDPALPLFGERPNSDRIDPSDAVFVDVIHTAGDSLGFIEDRGHADFFPNGGKNQPGCGIDIIETCSHGRAYEFMAESIWHTNGFPAFRCNNWDEYDSGQCDLVDWDYMGEPCSPSASGRYYLRTNGDPPYGQE